MTAVHSFLHSREQKLHPKFSKLFVRR